MKALLIGNSKHIDEARTQTLARDSQIIIAADGGADLCLKLKIQPHVVVGDMDSISNEARDIFSKGSDFHVHPSTKSKLDLELAYQTSLDRGASRVEVVGWSDERADFSISSLLAFQNSPVPLRLWTSTAEWQLVNQFQPSLELEGPLKVSVLSFSPVIRLSTKGFRWELKWSGAGPQISQSNEIPAKARLQLERGSAYIASEKLGISST